MPSWLCLEQVPSQWGSGSNPDFSDPAPAGGFYKGLGITLVVQRLGLPPITVPFAVFPESSSFPRPSIVKCSRGQVHELIHGGLGSPICFLEFSSNVWGRLSDKMSVN